MAQDQEAEAQFESDVRRISRIRFRTSFGGAEKEDGQERDGVFVTDDVIHIVEATVSRKQEKATTDISKIHKLRTSLALKHPHKVIKGWFITKEDPTADQRAVLKNAKYHGIEAVSYHQFMSGIVDGQEYLSLRENYPFGSARNPTTEHHRLDDKLLVGTKFHRDDGTFCATAELIGGPTKRIVIVGDFGSGKSVALREIYNVLSKPYGGGQSLVFPLLLNLRDHIGQKEPVEALERHARNIGYGTPSHLVRAWRAGLVHVLLDGFDEVSTVVWAGIAKQLRTLRRHSMQLVRAFVEQTPPETLVVAAGREHFFDSKKEMIEALGMRNATVVALHEFDEEQLASYLSVIKRSQSPLPDWFPTRPLLLSYLVTRGLLDESTFGEASAANGWHMLLDRVCERECVLEPGLDGGTLRHLIERLATACRASPDGVGPIAQAKIVQTFEDVCGYQPTEASLTLIQRLPGLGVYNAEDGSREFVDRDLAATAAAGDVNRFIEDPYNKETPEIMRGLSNSLPSLGIEVCVAEAERKSLQPGKVRAAIERSRSLDKASALQCDLVRVAMRLGVAALPASLPTISGVLLPEIDVQSELDLSGLALSECVIQTLALDREMKDEHTPLFSQCLIGIVEGRFGYRDLPPGRFPDSDIESFGESNETSSAILESELPLSVRVLLVCLRKLYMQRGTGRKESAFSRGVDHRARPYVSKILGILRAHKIVALWKPGTDTVWLPTKSGRSEAARIIANPSDREHAIVAEVWDME